MNADQTRFLFTIICDDVRQEVGNKLSMMGIYDHAIMVEQFPVAIPRISFVMKAKTTADRPFERLTFLVLRDEETLIEAEMDGDRLNALLKQSVAASIAGSTLEASDRILMVTAILTVAPLTIEKPCRLRFRALTESEELRGGTVAIDIGNRQDAQARSQIA
jgi:hypothetical protein